MKLPDAANDMDWDILGAIPMGLFTSYGAIFVSGETQPGDTILVHGASSSVGVWAILAGKSKGCTIIATTRQESKIQKLKDAGADYVILESDLKNQANLRKIAPKGVDTVVELIGLDQVETVTLPSLALHGTGVLVGILSNTWTLNFNPMTIPITRKLTTFTTLDEDLELAKKVLNDTIERVKSGEYKPEVFLDKVFQLKDIGAAHEYMEANKAVGKVVLHI